MIERWFGVAAAGSTVPRELRAALTTFLTMSYILLVNPDILDDAIRVEGAFPQLLTATALAAAAGTLVMGIVARYPFALAPGMGLNAYFAYTVVLGQEVPWTTALGAVFLSGLLVVILTVVGIRETLVAALPRELGLATAGGIGLFLAFIGLRNAGVVVDSPATLVALGDLHAAGPLLAGLGLTVTVALQARGVPGALLVGIAITSALAMVTGAPVFAGRPFAGFPDGIVQAPVWPVDLFLAMDVAGAVELGLVGILLTFTFVDLFDTAGTLIGLAEEARFTDADGRLPRAGRAFLADAAATTMGACFGTSSTTTYIESAAGISAGGRTGLVAVGVAALFLLAIPLWPLAAAVPAVATAPALIAVGASMMGGLASVDWRDPGRAVPAFLCVVAMPLTFSIANGISLGILAHVAIAVLAGRIREVHPVLWILAAMLAARFAWLAAG